jgi:hypothetical protein
VVNPPTPPQKSMREIIDEEYAKLRPPPPAAGNGANADRSSTAHHGYQKPGSSAFDRLDQLTSWADILERVDWTQVNPQDSAVLEGWRRPDGTHPVSAKVLKANPHVLVVHSEDAGLPSGAGQKNTKARVLAHLHYRGDESALAKALVRGEVVGVPAHVNDAFRAEWREPAATPPVTVLEPGAPAPASVPVEKHEADFWQAMPALAHIREFALARMASPWAVLGVCLLRQLAVIPPHVVLPPTIGGRASLNSIVALVGPSGAGKGAAEAAAEEALEYLERSVYQVPIGSGAGITHQYA